MLQCRADTADTRGVGQLSRRGRGALTRRRSSPPLSAYALLGGPVVVPESDVVVPGSDDGVYVPPELVADLYAPDLVITPGYIGPSHRGAPPRLRPRPVPDYVAPAASVTRLRLRLWEIVVVVVVTVAVAVPLTLIVSAYAGHPVAATPGHRTVHSGPAAPPAPVSNGPSTTSQAPTADQAAGRPVDQDGPGIG